MASHILLEVHLQIAPYLSASEGHFIGDMAVYRLRARFPDIKHVIFHIDTYDDEAENYCQVLPNRVEISRCLFAILDRYDATELKIHRLGLHYHTDAIEIDLQLNQQDTVAYDLPHLQQQLNTELSKHAWFGHLNLLVRHIDSNNQVLK
ncbi:cation transporter dimerization domain-containing protein [Aliamphritea spongicola]|nr:cation transporter dimerization domain-containing protein [Aliamphritea spongicola]